MDFTPHWGQVVTGKFFCHLCSTLKDGPHWVFWTLPHVCKHATCEDCAEALLEEDAA